MKLFGVRSCEIAIGARACVCGDMLVVVVCLILLWFSFCSQRWQRSKTWWDIRCYDIFLVSDINLTWKYCSVWKVKSKEFQVFLTERNNRIKCEEIATTTGEKEMATPCRTGAENSINNDTPATWAVYIAQRVTAAIKQRDRIKFGKLNILQASTNLGTHTHTRTH